MTMMKKQNPALLDKTNAAVKSSGILIEPEDVFSPQSQSYVFPANLSLAFMRGVQFSQLTGFMHSFLTLISLPSAL